MVKTPEVPIRPAELTLASDLSEAFIHIYKYEFPTKECGI